MAAGESAAAVAGDQGSPQLSGDGRGGVTDGDGLSCVGEDGNDGSVAEHHVGGDATQARGPAGQAVQDAQRLLDHDELGSGSMAPKVEAAISFLKTGGKKAHIARLDEGLEALNEEAGTTITL